MDRIFGYFPKIVSIKCTACFGARFANFPDAAASFHSEGSGGVDWHGSLRGSSFPWPGIARTGA